MEKLNLRVYAAAAALLGLIVLFFTACAHTPAQQEGCQELDWYELGRQDGTKGLNSQGRRKVAAVCQDSDQSLSEALYNNGFDAGVFQFCSPESGFELGRANVALSENLCPPLVQNAFLIRYRQGQKYVELETQQKEINRRIQSLNDSLRDSSIEIVKRGLLNGEKLQLQEKKKTLEAEIRDLKNSQGKNSG